MYMEDVPLYILTKDRISYIYDIAQLGQNIKNSPNLPLVRLSNYDVRCTRFIEAK